MSTYSDIRSYVFLWMALLWSLQVSAQFLGGTSDGFDQAQDSTIGTLHAGASGDGFAYGLHSPSSGIFPGGSGDGFAYGQHYPTDTISRGGSSDGFDLALRESSHKLFHGEDHDGYSSAIYTSSHPIYYGASQDGHDFGIYLYYHAWTGAINTDWLVAGNWTSNIIPTDSIRVRIPGTAPNMPGLNAGTFKVGAGASGTYLCRDLWIEQGASMLAKPNTYIINRSTILVDGVFKWRNQDEDSFINRPGSRLRIRSGGVVTTDF